MWLYNHRYIPLRWHSTCCAAKCGSAQPGRASAAFGPPGQSELMGNFLDTPITEKETEVGSDKKMSYGLSAMQGWRAQMEDDHVQLLSLDKVRANYALSKRKITTLSTVHRQTQELSPHSPTACLTCGRPPISRMSPSHSSCVGHGCLPIIARIVCHRRFQTYPYSVYTTGTGGIPLPTT